MDHAADLYLQDLDHGCGCITPAWGAGLAEAASVCLDAQGHESPKPFDVSGHINHQHTLHWLRVSEQMRRCFDDPEDAAEHGAYGIAALLVAKHTSFEVLDRSRKGTGFDYWLGDRASASIPFASPSARLEVSGIGNGAPSAVRARVKQKLVQTSPTDALGLPAFVVVVEYGTPLAQVASK